MEYEYIPYITLDELKELRDKIKAEHQYRFESAAYFESETYDVAQGLSIAVDIVNKKISELEKR